MERHGFIHDMLDVKVLILYVMSLVEMPVSAQTIYELCLQDDCLSYMDVQQAIPQMVQTGHLQKEGELYTITEKGREAEPLTNASIAFPVRHRAKSAVEALNRAARQEQFIRTEVRPCEDESGFIVSMKLNDLHGQLMHLELTMPTRLQAKRVEAAYRKNPDMIYQSVIVGLLEETEGRS